MQTLNKMRAKLEKESANHNDQLNDMSVRLEELQRLLDFERNERQQLELAVKNGSLPDDAKVISATYLIGVLTNLLSVECLRNCLFCCQNRSVCHS